MLEKFSFDERVTKDIEQASISVDVLEELYVAYFMSFQKMLGFYYTTYLDNARSEDEMINIYQWQDRYGDFYNLLSDLAYKNTLDTYNLVLHGKKREDIAEIISKNSYDFSEQANKKFLDLAQKINFNRQMSINEYAIYKRKAKTIVPGSGFDTLEFDTPLN